nr:RnfABCDGE type electron transport complex subunit G [uncultured Fretibacterium sp.]
MTDAAEMMPTPEKSPFGNLLGKSLYLGGTLFLVTAVTGLILGLVQWATADAIRAAQEKEKALALMAVMPDAESFKPMDPVPGAGSVLGVEEALKGSETVGHCITVTSKGYGGPIEIVVGVTKGGAVRAIRILKQSETPGLGAKAPEPFFSGQFENRERLPLNVVKQTPSAPNEIQAISGATITSSAVTAGVNAAVDYWKRNIEGGLK